MKITFEGTYYEDILAQMANVLAATARQGDAATAPAQAAKNISKSVSEKSTTTALPTAKAVQGPGPDVFAEQAKPPVNKPVQITGDKPGRTEKQKANDERLRERALAKKAAGLKVGDKTPKALAPPPVDEPPVDPVEVVKIRQKTIEDLQSAYANGHQQEVFELLSRFGNGAKSFRELPPEAFLPISQAIAKGALT